MNNKLIVANWKNHPDTLAEAEGILEFANNYLESLGDKKEFSLVFCPPFVFTEEVAKKLKMSHLEHNAELGAQDIANDDKLTLTGEISGLMLQKLGVRYVIIGHSERRWKLNESNEVVNKKLKSVLINEMIPIVCIGEREKNEDYKKFLENQISETFQGLTANEVGKCIIAYEPVWAIGTGKVATDEQAQEVHKYIRQRIADRNPVIAEKVQILYGGSVKPDNAKGLFAMPDIDGGLVGGASLDAKGFLQICHSV